LVGIGIALTWSSDVFAIIAYASRAFSVYYALQAALAAHLAWRRKEQRWIVYAGLALLGIVIALFGTAIE
jgi:amino acid permease